MISFIISTFHDAQNRPNVLPLAFIDVLVISIPGLLCTSWLLVLDRVLRTRKNIKNDTQGTRKTKNTSIN